MEQKVKVELLKMNDPTFDAGSVHTAKATLSNPTPQPWQYSVELYLGVTKVATSGVGNINIPASGSLEVTFSVTMPLIEGEYEVYLDINSGSTLIKHYKATENITIVVKPAIDVTSLIWQ